MTGRSGKGVYLMAHAAYHAEGTPFLPWTVVMDWHLQHGVVVAAEEVFVMARRVDGSRPEEHALLVAHAGPGVEVAGVWHIWSAAGDLGRLTGLGVLHGVREVTFQRKGGRLHRWGFGRLVDKTYLTGGDRVV